MYSIRAEADAELDGILRYGLEAWGEAKAMSYFLAIFTEIERCAEEPGIGAAVPDFDPQMRKWPAAEHLIFYRILETEIEIIRVAHQNSDILKWLNKQAQMKLSQKG